MDPCLLDNPCSINSICIAENHSAKCVCKAGTEGDPLENCIVIGCSQNEDCPSNVQCLNGKCKDPCQYNNTCAPGAFCSFLNNKITCTCPPDFTGNPSVACKSISADITCLSDYDCSDKRVCMTGQCVNPCKDIKPCQDSFTCDVAKTKPLKMITCSCPLYSSSSDSGSCQESKINIIVR